MTFKQYQKKNPLIKFGYLQSEVEEERLRAFRAGQGNSLRLVILALAAFVLASEIFRLWPLITKLGILYA